MLITHQDTLQISGVRCCHFVCTEVNGHKLYFFNVHMTHLYEDDLIRLHHAKTMKMTQTSSHLIKCSYQNEFDPEEGENVADKVEVL